MTLTLKIEARGMAPRSVKFANLPVETIYQTALAVCQAQIPEWNCESALYLHDLCTKGYVENCRLRLNWFWATPGTLVTILPGRDAI